MFKIQTSGPARIRIGGGSARRREEEEKRAPGAIHVRRPAGARRPHFTVTAHYRPRPKLLIFLILAALLILPLCMPRHLKAVRTMLERFGLVAPAREPSPKSDTAAEAAESTRSADEGHSVRVRTAPSAGGAEK